MRDRLAVWLIRTGWRLASPRYRAKSQPTKGLQGVTLRGNTYTASTGTSVLVTYR